MSFSEVCIYQVNPKKVDEFEVLMKNNVLEFMEKQEGLLLHRLAKREYKIDMEQIKNWLPPKEITRIVKCVRYVLYWEFNNKENYGIAQKNLYESYWKAIEKCLIVTHAKYLGNTLF